MGIKQDTVLKKVMPFRNIGINKQSSHGKEQPHPIIQHAALNFQYLFNSTAHMLRKTWSFYATATF